MGQHCCGTQDDYFLSIYNSFWEPIKIRTRTQNDLMEVISINDFSESEEYSKDKRQKITSKLIKEFLTSRKNNDIYESFWNNTFHSVLNSDDSLYFLLFSLLFLCIDDKENLEKNIIELNRLFPKKSKDVKISRVLTYYFNLITNFCTVEVCQLNNIEKEEIVHLNEIYDSSIINSYIDSFTINEDDNLASNLQFLIKNSHYLSDDDYIRQQINRTYLIKIKDFK
jgi:hypothetical protein